MLYTEDTRIEALAVHVVGNKSKDEPLTVSPNSRHRSPTKG